MTPSGVLVLALAAMLAAVMGASIQRGATCLVAAVDEIVTQGRARRLLAMAEAAAWVGGGLVVARALDALPRVPVGVAPALATVAGAAMLGAGAWVNRACVFGAIARFASGDAAYLATPLGFFAGCVVFDRWPPGAPPRLLAPGAPLLEAASMGRSLAAGLALALAAAAIVRVGWAAAAVVRRARVQANAPGPLALGRGLVLAPLQSPHAATVLIGLAFLALMRLAGPWAYTDVLADWARGRMADALVGGTLLVALYAGAAWGGRHRPGRWRTRPAARDLLRCLAGGAMMGWGSQWIPGGNDGLILMGLPLGYPYAWLAVGTMALSMAVPMTLSRRRTIPSPTLRGSPAAPGRTPP
jgi:toxin CptA